MNDQMQHTTAIQHSPEHGNTVFDHGMALQFMLAVVFLIGTAVLQYTVEVLDGAIPETVAASPTEGSLQASVRQAVFGGAAGSALRVSQGNRARYQIRSMFSARVAGKKTMAILPATFHRSRPTTIPGAYHGPYYPTSASAPHGASQH